MAYAQLRLFSPSPHARRTVIDELASFQEFRRPTGIFVEEGLRYFVNEYWTSRQRQSHNLHEISYRACFKAELPRFFIERLTAPGDLVFDPFMGRGTTLLEGALLRRRVAGNDINPLSAMLIRPRLAPPLLPEIDRRLREIPWSKGHADANSDLLVFYHPGTLREICALRQWLSDRSARREFDAVDDWIRLVAINRLTGHSSGFLSVYTLPPNQAVSVESQRRINERRGQTPPRRDVHATIVKKSRTLLSDGAPDPNLPGQILTGPAWNTKAIGDDAVSLLITSPPFLDTVNYRQDNWLRCWFAGIDPASVAIDHHRTVADWERFVRKCFEEFCRIVRPGGHIAFEVGEVRNGSILLERHVAAAARGLPLSLLGVVVNDQQFTKTANCWGVGNNRSGTNTNRIVLFEKHARG